MLNKPFLFSPPTPPPKRGPRGFTKGFFCHKQSFSGKTETCGENHSNFGENAHKHIKGVFFSWKEEWGKPSQFWEEYVQEWEKNPKDVGKFTKGGLSEKHVKEKPSEFWGKYMQEWKKPRNMWGNLLSEKHVREKTWGFT